MSVTLKSRLPEIAAELRSHVNAAIHLAAEAVEKSAKERVPVNTGRLRDAIHVEKEGRGYLVVAGNTEAWYGHLVEHGTTHSPGHPFLIPSLEENRPVAVEIVSEALRHL